METVWSVNPAAAARHRRPPRLGRHRRRLPAGRTATARRSGAIIPTAFAAGIVRTNGAWTVTTTAGPANGSPHNGCPACKRRRRGSPPRRQLSVADWAFCRYACRFPARRCSHRTGRRSSKTTVLLPITSRTRARRCRGLSRCSGCRCAFRYHPRSTIKTREGSVELNPMLHRILDSPTCPAMTEPDLETSGPFVCFFQRYYAEGDFLAKRVYKPGVYAIPYEGEEVTLHWANKDHYYIKTSEYLRDYAFRLRHGRSAKPTRRCRVRVRAAGLGWRAAGSSSGFR